MFTTDRPTGNDPLVGPVDLDYARNCLRGLSVQSFLARYRRPALLLSLSATGESPAESQIALVASRGSSRHPTEDEIPFQKPVTLGRSPSADITLRVKTVSSLHASFELIGGDWTLADNGSTNGTFLGDRVLDSSGHRHILASGDTIRLGPDLLAQFLMPPDLVPYLLS